jgi:hypothetical protein
MKTFGTGLVFLCMLLAPSVASSGMTVLDDGDLAAFHAGSGVSLGISGTITTNVGSFWWQDTDTGNRIELQNIVNAISFATPTGDSFTLDIGSNAAGNTIMILEDPTVFSSTFSANLHFLEYVPGYSGPDNYDPGYYVPASGIPNYINNYIVHDLGSIEVNGLVSTENNWLIGAHGGISFEYQTKMNIASAQYIYNTASSANALTFTGINFSGLTGTGPFQIGDLTSLQPNPATIDIGSNAAGTTEIILNLPMTGSIRVADVNYGGSDFGPLALNGLDVHRLIVQINPNPPPHL